MGKNGGKRPGAGRKKAQHTIATEKMREFLVNKIAEEMEPILQAQIDAAKGISFEEVDKDGNRINVYKKLPDTKAGEYLLNQGVGKPKETTELTGKDGGPVQVTGINYIKPNADNNTPNS